MKRASFKAKSYILLILVAFALSGTSCNRGVGCPTNFSADKLAGNAVQQVVDIILDHWK